MRPRSASVKAPPLGFDYQSPEILGISTAAVAEHYPEPSDLAEGGSLVRIQKKQYGPVPEWRSEFVEPEEIWLLGTNRISRDSSLDVDRVLRILRPDNGALQKQYLAWSLKRSKAVRNSKRVVGVIGKGI